MKNSSDTIGNQTRDLLACSAVPQPIAPPRAPIYTFSEGNSSVDIYYNMAAVRKYYLEFNFNGYRKWRNENLVQYGRKVDHKVYLNTVHGYYFYASSYKYGDDAKLLVYI
jgi:hypothetical protein